MNETTHVCDACNHNLPLCICAALTTWFEENGSLLAGVIQNGKKKETRDSARDR